MTSSDVIIGLVVLAMTATLGCGSEDDAGPVIDAGPAPRTVVVVNDRTALIGKYPCLKCHQKLEMRPATSPPRAPHDAIRVEHMEGANECYVCHYENNLNMLRLMSREVVDFRESERLCGQCHAEKKKDWDLGIHGKMVGNWRGLKHKYTCADCHNPHNPKIPQVWPAPAPPFPKLGIRKKH